MTPEQSLEDYADLLEPIADDAIELPPLREILMPHIPTSMLVMLAFTLAIAFEFLAKGP